VKSDRTTSFERRSTRQIHVGKVAVGGGAPISVQSMTITKTADVEGTLQQIYALAAAGCDIVRCTCNEAEAAEGLAQIVPRSPIPVIADIHHQYKMALAAMEAGVHGLRLNPGNIRRPEHIKAVAAEAKDRGLPIRIGVNGGSVDPALCVSSLTAMALGLSSARSLWVSVRNTCPISGVCKSSKSCATRSGSSLS
jgi:(E)-4-hydroxy-3-methylbut-2-enyl-diphosphate synthase